MRILKRKDFLAITKPVVFQKYRPMILGDICIKGETLRLADDFLYINLMGCDVETARCQPNDSGELADLWDCFLNGDIDFQRDYDAYARDGCHEGENECWFVVYDKDDIRTLIDILKETL